MIRIVEKEEKNYIWLYLPQMPSIQLNDTSQGLKHPPQWFLLDAGLTQVFSQMICPKTWSSVEKLTSWTYWNRDAVPVLTYLRGITALGSTFKLWTLTLHGNTLLINTFMGWRVATWSITLEEASFTNTRACNTLIITTEVGTCGTAEWITFNFIFITQAFFNTFTLNTCLRRSATVWPAFSLAKWALGRSNADSIWTCLRRSATVWATLSLARLALRSRNTNIIRTSLTWRTTNPTTPWKARRTGIRLFANSIVTNLRWSTALSVAFGRSNWAIVGNNFAQSNAISCNNSHFTFVQSNAAFVNTNCVTCVGALWITQCEEECQ